MPSLLHSSSSSVNEQWITAQRSQFTVDLPSEALLALLLALSTAQVNLAALVQQADPQDVQSNVFVFVVGYADPHDPRNSAQVATTKRILQERQIVYEHHLILEANFLEFSGVPGSFAGAITTLSQSAGVRPRILRAYFGEEGSIWLDVGTSPQDLAAIDLLIKNFIIKQRQERNRKEHKPVYHGCCFSSCFPALH